MLLVISFITIFVIIVFIFCYYFIKYYRQMIYLHRANNIIETYRNRRVVPETIIEIPELPLPIAEGIKIDNEIENLEIIQIN